MREGTIFFLPREECGTTAYRSINIKSSRKYNLLTHCSPSGVRRLAGARRMKCIVTHAHTHMQAKHKHTHAHTPIEVSQDHRTSFLSWLGLLMYWLPLIAFST